MFEVVIRHILDAIVKESRLLLAGKLEVIFIDNDIKLM